MIPVISESVYRKLIKLLKRFNTPGVKILGNELSKARVVKDSELRADVVSLNSIVEFITESLTKPMRMQIVLPEEADLSERRISVFAPISIALLGFSESNIVDCQMPSGYKQLKILRVINP